MARKRELQLFHVHCMKTKLKEIKLLSGLVLTEQQILRTALLRRDLEYCSAVS